VNLSAAGWLACLTLQIVQFILSNTSVRPGPALDDLPITGGGCDPFTGEFEVELVTWY
jgi:hypothetical protein